MIDKNIKYIKVVILLLASLFMGWGLQVLTHDQGSPKEQAEINRLSAFQVKEFQGDRFLQGTSTKKTKSWTLDQLTDLEILLRDRNGKVKQVGNCLETILMKMGHPQEKILMQSNTDPKTTLSLLYRRETDGAPCALRLLFTKGRDGSYLLSEVDASQALTKKEKQEVFSEKVFNGIEVGEEMDLAKLLKSYKGLQTLILRQVEADQAGFHLVYRDEKAQEYVLEVEKVDGSYVLLRKSQVGTPTVNRLG